MEKIFEAKEFPICLFDLFDYITISSYDDFEKFLSHITKYSLNSHIKEFDKSFNVMNYYNKYFSCEKRQNFFDKLWLKYNKPSSEEEKKFINYLKNINEEDRWTIIEFIYSNGISNSIYFMMPTDDNSWSNIVRFKGITNTKDIKTLFDSLESDGILYLDFKEKLNKLKELGFKKFTFNPNLDLDGIYYFNLGRYYFSDGNREYQIPIEGDLVKITNPHYIINDSFSNLSEFSIIIKSFAFELNCLPTKYELANPTIDKEITKELSNKKEIIENSYWRKYYLHNTISNLKKLRLLLPNIANDNMPCNQNLCVFLDNPSVLEKYLTTIIENSDLDYINSGIIKKTEFQIELDKVKKREFKRNIWNSKN